MTSKAERKRRKRTVLIAKGGRPRLDGPREPNGRLDRKWQGDANSRAATQAVRDARQRLFGLSESVCSQPEAMTVLGRLRLAEQVSVEQADAARSYQELRVRYQRAIAAAPDYDEPAPAPWDRTGMDFEEWVQTTKAQHADMQQALADLCMELRSPAPRSALDVIVVRDVDMPELVGALRLALNALHRHFTEKKAQRGLAA